MAEPWLLLPLLYARRGAGGWFAEYNQQFYNRAFSDFCKHLPGGQVAYDKHLRRFVLGLYQQAALGSSRYFLDKTPRYHLVVSDILDIFPDARCIFLWRNPLAIVASIIETFGKGRWNIHRYRIDLYRGLDNLVRAAQDARERVLTVRYEDLVTVPDITWPRVFEYLELDFQPELLESFSDVRLQGRFGDPTRDRYEHLSTAPLEKWKHTMRGTLRRRWALRYLDWIGAERLSVMGYDLGILKRDLEAIKPSFHALGRDVVDMSRTLVQPWVEPAVWRRKRALIARHEPVVAHY